MYFLLRMEKAAQREIEAVVNALAIATPHGIIWAMSRSYGTSSFHLRQVQVTKDAEHVERSVALPVVVSVLLLRWQGRQPVWLIRAGLQVEEPDDICRHHLVGFVGGNAREVLVDDGVRVRVF
jgi:hypothetical protein